MNAQAGYTVGVQWGDCDPAQIVFYPNYFKWFDSASQTLLARILPPKRELLQRFQIIGFPIAEASARFLRPSTYGQSIVFDSTIESIQEKRFTVLHRGLRDGGLLLEGREMRFAGRVHPDNPNRLQAIVLPDELVASFETVRTRS